jgi:hypothetical protein
MISAWSVGQAARVRSSGRVSASTGRSGPKRPTSRSPIMRYQTIERGLRPSAALPAQKASSAAARPMAGVRDLIGSVAPNARLSRPDTESVVG